MSDDERPRPRYGEYAPGYTPAEQPPEAAPEATRPAAEQPSGAPGTPPPPMVPTPAPWTATGAPGTATGYEQGGYGPTGAGYVAPVKKRSTVDLVFTIVLLVLGFFGVLFAVVYAAIFANPEVLDEGLRQQGQEGFNGDVGQSPLVLVVSHVVLYLAAVGLSILSLVKKRITFWIPLVIGVVAAVIFWVTVGSVLASDPTLMQNPGF